MSTNAPNVLQQAFVLATGTAASPTQLAELQALVTQDNGGYALVAQHFETMMDGFEAANGQIATAKSIALNGFGQVLSDADATSIMAMLAAQGITTWAKILEFCILLQGNLGQILDNRAAAADSFDAEITSQAKASYYTGATVEAAVRNFLQEIDASQLSLANANAGLQTVADNLGAGGLTATASDGYLAHAQVFVDANGNGQLDSGEYTTTTNDNGDYTIPAAQATGTVVVTGGTDLLTGHAFLGTLTALPGSTMASPISSMVQAMIAGGFEGSTGAAVWALTQALQLPTGVDLLSYDPLAVIGDSGSSAGEKAAALKVLAVSLQIANIMTELSAVIDAANAKAGHPSDSSAQVAAALAAAIAAAAAQDGGTGTIDLSSNTVLAGIITTAATAAGASDIVTHAGDVAQVIAAVNAAAAGATNIADLSRVAVVSQGAVVSALEGAEINGTWSGMLATYTGTNLTALIAAQTPGEILPGMPVPLDPLPPMPPTFYIILSGDVVTFFGRQTGDITISWSGTPGASTATFARGGLVADQTVDFPAYATSISLTSTQQMVVAAADLAGVPVAGAGTVALTDTDILASTLLALDGTISCNFDASSVATITGSMADMLSIYASTIIGLGNEAVTLTDATLAATDLIALSADTTGQVDATAATAIDGAAADIVTVINDSGITTPTNYDSTVSDTDVAASDLLAISADNGTGIVDATGVSSINGSAADVAAVVADAEITIPSDFDSTIAAGAAAAADLNAISAATTGTVDASLATSIDGDASAIATVIDDTGITKPTDFGSVISATDSAALDLLHIEANNGSGIVNASATTSIDGAAADIVSVIDNADITKPADFPSVISASATAAADLLYIDTNNGSGTIDASAATTIDGAAADIVLVINDADITTPANYNSTVSDTDVEASDLLAISADNGSGTITATGVSTINGSAADVADVVADSSISIPTDFDSTISAGVAQAADLNAISAATTGTVDASAATDIDGDASAIVTVIDDTGITKPTAFHSTITATASAALDLLYIDSHNGTGTVDASAATSIDGAAADIVSVLNDANITAPSDFDSAITATATAASDLLTISAANGTGAIDASLATTIDGAAADIVLVINDADITTPTNYNSTVSDTDVEASDLLAISADNGSGTITASGVSTINGSAADVADVVSDVSITKPTDFDSTIDAGAAAAADLITISTGNGLGTIDASAATDIDGSAADIVTVINDLDITKPANFDSNITASANLAGDLLAIDAANGSGIVDATGTTDIDGNAANIVLVINDTSILKPANFDSLINAGTVQAADLLAIDAGNGTGAIDATLVTLLKGITTDVLAALADAGITFSGSEDVKVTDNIVVADANTIAAATTGIVTATINDNDLATLTKLTVEANNAYTITVKDATVDAGDMNYVDSATTVAVKAGPVTLVTGSVVDIEAMYVAVGAGTITGLGNEAVTPDDATVSVADANSIAGSTTGPVTATITEQTLAALVTLAPSETNNYWTEVIADTTAAASDLNIVDAATKVAIDATAITTITGLAADVKTALNSNGFTNLGDENVTLSDITLDAPTLNKVDQSTTGVVDAGTVTTLTGTASSIKTSYDNNNVGIKNLGDENVTLSDTTLSATLLNTLDADTSGVVDAGSVLTLTGNAATVAASYAANGAGIKNLGDEAVTLSDGTLAADVLNTINGATTGVVDASAAGTLSGPAADIQADYTAAGKGEISGLDGSENLTATDSTIAVATANALAALTTGVVKATINEGDLTTLKTLTETTNNYTIVLTDTTGVLATDLSAVDGKTIGKIDASSVLDISGSAAEVDAVYQSNGFSGLGNEDVTLTTNPNVSEANTVDADTNGVITATITDGTVSTLKTLTGKNNAYSITVKDASVIATEINTVDAATTVTGGVDVTAVTTLKGLLTDVDKAYSSTGITGWSASLNVTLDDASITAIALNTADGITTGTVDATAATSVTGKMADLLTAVQSAGIKLNNPNVTVSDGTLAAADILTLDGKTSGSIDVNSATKITGTAADLETLYTNAAADSILGLGNENDVVVDAPTSYVDANKIAGATTGVVTATIGEGDLVSLVKLTDAQINAYTITISDTTAVSASDLNYINAQTSVKVDASAVSSITGVSTDIDTLYVAAPTDFKGLGNEAITATDSISVSEANGIDGYTTGAVTATLSDKSLALLTGLTGTNNNYTITVSDTSILATDINKVDAADALAGGINVAAVTDMEGVIADISTALKSSGITGWSGTLNVKLDDTSATASALSGADSIVGGAVDASSVTSVSGTAAELLFLYGAAGITGLGNENVTITDATLAASDALAVDNKTSGSVTVNATKLTGTSVDIKSVYGNAYGSLGDESVVVSDTIAYGDANTIAAATTGIVTAGVSDTLANLVKLTDTQTNAYTITIGVGDASASASDLNTVNTQTSVKIDASNVTSITGTSADIDTLYGSASTDFKGLGNEAITVTDSISVAEANGIDGYTSQPVTATLSDKSLALLTGLSGTNNKYTITVSDTSVLATDINKVDAADALAAGVNVAAVTDIEGLLADVNAAYTSSGITGWSGTLNVKLDDTSLGASSLNAADIAVGGTLDAGSLTSLSGLASELLTAYGAAGITGLGNESLTVTDTTLLASELVSLYGKTSGSIDVSAATKLKGTAADIEAVYANAATEGITGLGDEADVVVDASILYSDANTIAAATTGIVSATVGDTLANLVKLTDTQTNAYTITIGVGDASASASDLNTVNTQTSVKIDASNVTSITGTSADIDTLYGSASTDFKGLGNEALTVTDGISVLEATKIDGYTSGAVTATISDHALATLVGLAGTTNNAWTTSLNDTNVAAADLITLDKATTVAVDASSVTGTVSGSGADIKTVFTSAGITGLGAASANVSDNLTVANANTVAAATTGTVTATISDQQLSKLITLTETHAYTVTTSDTTGKAADVNTVDSHTTVIVNATSLTTITGAFADFSTLATAVSGSQVSLSGTVSVQITDTAAALTGQTWAAAGASDQLSVGATSGSAVDLTKLTGFETIKLTSGTDLVTIADGAGTAVTASGASNVTLGASGQTFTGSGSNDTVTGGSGGDTINGGGGADTIDGKAGADNILGGNGNDTITGGDGADTITGGAGKDAITLTDTDSAVDTVVIDSNTAGNADTITGFVSGQDLLQFSMVGVVLNALDYSVGSLTVIDAATAGALGAGAWNNHIVVDTAANIALLNVGSGGTTAATGAVLAIATDVGGGTIYYDADGNFAAGKVAIGVVGVALATGDAAIIA